MISTVNINKEKCKSCGVCAEKCPFGSILIVDGYPFIADDCRSCGICSNICPERAISVIGYSKKNVQNDLWSGILIYVQHSKESIHPITFEMAGAAKKLSEKTGGKIYAISITEKADVDLSSLNGMADEIFNYYEEDYKDFKDDAYAEVLIDCIKKVRPEIVLIGATAEGRMLAPRVAVAFKTGVTADCTALDIDNEGNLIQIRPAFGGNIMAEIITAYTRPQIATIREKVMCTVRHDSNKKTVIKKGKLNLRNDKTLIKVLGKEISKPARDIAEQRILVAIGNGIDNKEDICLFEKFADKIGGMLASSRALVEKGWMPGERQIGISGKTVRCELLIACGISGSVQFMAGAMGAKYIIAINMDENAPIFQIANMSVCANMYEIVSALMENL